MLRQACMLYPAVLLLLIACSPTERPAAATVSEPATFEAALEEKAAQAPVAPRVGFSPASIAGMTKMDDRAWVKANSLWRRPSAIPVCWEAGAEAHTMEMAWVRDAIDKSWDAASPEVKFIRWGTCTAKSEGIRIRVRDAGPRTLGLGSDLDGKADGMLLNFTFANWSRPCATAARREGCIRKVAVHEFGHALGFAHEHNRWDTPGECLEPAQGSNGDLILTPWDPDSEMNYCNDKADGILSSMDIDGLRKAYPSVG